MRELFFGFEGRIPGRAIPPPIDLGDQIAKVFGIGKLLALEIDVGDVAAGAGSFSGKWSHPAAGTWRRRGLRGSAGWRLGGGRLRRSLGRRFRGGRDLWRGPLGAGRSRRRDQLDRIGGRRASRGRPHRDQERHERSGVNHDRPGNAGPDRPAGQVLGPCRQGVTSSSSVVIPRLVTPAARIAASTRTTSPYAARRSPLR